MDSKQPEVKKENKYTSRKLIVTLIPLYFILVVASVFTFLVGEVHSGTHEWIGRLSTKEWVSVSMGCALYAGAYIVGNVSEGGVEFLKGFLQAYLTKKNKK